MPPPHDLSALRTRVEDFLYRDAMLLDAFRFDEWLATFSAEGRYQVPPLDTRDADPEDALYLVDDDHMRLSSRIRQLLSGKTFSEAPQSRTRRAVTNVRVEPLADGSIRVHANFVIHRFRHELIDTFVGRYEHQLVEHEDELRFEQRKAVLDHQALRPQGKLSIIL